MATLDETLAELKGITKALADHAIGNKHRRACGLIDYEDGA